MKIRKLLFVLPNLFTVSSIFCGFYAVVLCSGDALPAQLYQAALCILFAAFFDGFDGRVARLTKTQSQFGVELDSLADVMSFGIAPALLVYKWALAPLGMLGVFFSFVFAACGALRLARFNVLAQRSPHGGSSRFFIGLPIPLAAGVIVSVVIAQHGADGGPLPASARVPVAVLVVILSLLMVSTVRYRTFKDVRPSVRTGTVLAALAAVGLLVGTKLHPAFVVASYFATYLVFGLLESGLLLRTHLVQRRTASIAAAEEALAQDALEDDALDEDDEPRLV